MLRHLGSSSLLAWRRVGSQLLRANKPSRILLRTGNQSVYATLNTSREAAHTQRMRFCSQPAPQEVIVKYGKLTASFMIKDTSYTLSQLYKEASNHFQLEETAGSLQIIHGAHPNLTQAVLDMHISQNRAMTELLDDHPEIYQPFLELRVPQDYESIYHSSSRRSDFSAVISEHLASYCLRPQTLRDVMRQIVPDITVEELETAYMRRSMKMIYPNLLRFQCSAHSLLSSAEFDELGIDSKLPEPQVSQILTPIFVAFFSRSDNLSYTKLRSPKPSKSNRREKDTLLNEVPERLANLCNPHLWYPLARQMKRKVILHVGPTNSGKTHAGLVALKKAASGVYCGPLRLLAQEIYEKFQVEGVPINLLTGQLRHLEEESTHLSCTVEMAPTDTLYHCAVIDEIQMISDPDRGWAWTRVLLGIPAREIHLCGNETVIDVIKEIVNACGDELEIKEYTRLSPLKVPQEPLETIYDLKRGDCIITFSRSKIFAIKNQIERELKQKCCVVYGRLPPETRSQQAKLFNEPENDYPFLVATDAIGMGLNLNIKRVVFSDVVKFDGKSDRPLAPAELKQIAGRAGRFKSIYPVGFATSFDNDHQKLIRQSISASLKQSPFAGILPAYEQIELFALGTAQDGVEMPFSEILEEFTALATVDNEFFLCGFDSLLQIAKAIDDIPLQLKDRYIFCLSPCQTSNPFVMRFLRQYAQQFSELSSRQGSKDILPTRPSRSALILGEEEEEVEKVPLGVDEDMCSGDMDMVENAYAVLDLYLWLSWRFSSFLDRDAAQVLQQICNQRIESSLKSQSSALLKNKKKRKSDSQSSGRKYK